MTCPFHSKTFQKAARALLAALCLCSLLMTASCTATDGNGFLYESRDDGTYAVGIQDRNAKAEINVPAEFREKAVTAVKSFGFSGHEDLVRVTLPDTVTGIGYYAFGNCSSLSEIELPEGLTDLCESAFYGCSSLAKITIPDGVRCIDDCTFYRCTSLSDVTIGRGVTDILCSAFGDCTSLEVIRYCGTVEEWNAIFKDGAWISDSAVTTVSCTDGDVTVGE